MVGDDLARMVRGWAEKRWPQAAESFRFDIQRLRPDSEYLIAWSEIRRAGKLPRPPLYPAFRHHAQGGRDFLGRQQSLARVLLGILAN
jgi:hypothetical protein